MNTSPLKLASAAIAATVASVVCAGIRVEKYGTTADGEAVRRYALSNVRGSEAEFIDYGARIVRLAVPDRYGKRANVTLGYPSLADYEKGDVSFGSMIGRVVNRISGARFELDGKTYELPRNFERDGLSMCLHGGNRSWARRVWSSRPLEEEGRVGVEMSLTDRDGTEGFPGTVRFTVRYWLTDEDVWRIETEATTDRATPLNPAQHAYFNLTGDFSRPVTNHLLRLNATLSTPTGLGDLPTGEILNVSGRAWDYRLRRELGPVPLNLNYVPDMPAGVLRKVAGFEDPASGRTLEVATTLPGLQVYDGRHIGFTGCAFEAQYYPDAVNRPEFPGCVLRPGEVRRDVTEYRFGVAHPLAFAAPFTDGAILQRELPVAVFGKARPGAAVTVRFGGHEAKGAADAAGKWLVELPAMAAEKAPRTLSVESEGAVRTVEDVRVGEVWLAVGQSNMELPLCGARPHFRDGQGWLIAGMTRRNEEVRFAHAATYTKSAEPVGDINLTWAPLCQDYLEGHLYVSALATQFERELYTALDVPVGVIGAYWGGTCIEPWTPDGPWAKLPKAKSPYGQQCSHHLFNANLAPVAPYTVRGMIWYQGESNASKAKEYRARMHELYDGLSHVFRNSSLKFIFSQVAPYAKVKKGQPKDEAVQPYPTSIQDQQARFAAEETNAWMAVIADVGNPDDIHPNDKRTVARRFAALALRHCYGWTRLVADSPTVKSATADGNRVTLRFDNGGALYSYVADFGPAKGFELKSADGAWHAAKAVNEERGGIFKGAVIELEAEGVEAPTGVRYLRTPPYVGTVFGGTCLPLGTFELELGDE